MPILCPGYLIPILLQRQNHGENKSKSPTPARNHFTSSTPYPDRSSSTAYRNSGRIAHLVSSGNSQLSCLSIRLVACRALAGARGTKVAPLALDAVLNDPGVLLNFLQRQPLLRVKDKQLKFTLAMGHRQNLNHIELTFLIKSLASGLTKLGMVISALAILRWVMTGVSSNGASPTKNS